MGFVFNREGSHWNWLITGNSPEFVNLIRRVLRQSLCDQNTFVALGIPKEVTHSAWAWGQSLQMYGSGVGIREKFNARFMQDRPRLDRGYLFLQRMKFLSRSIQTPGQRKHEASGSESTSANAPGEPPRSRFFLDRWCNLRANLMKQSGLDLWPWSESWERARDKS